MGTVFGCHDKEKGKFFLFFSRGHFILPELHLSCNSKKFIHELREVKVQFMPNELNFNFFCKLAKRVEFSCELQINF